MHAFRSIACSAAALLFAMSASAAPSTTGAGGVARRADLKSRNTASLQTILDDLKAKTGPISKNYQKIAAAAPTTPTAATTASMNDENSSLEEALNVAVAGVTKLLGQVKGDVNLLNLAGTIVAIVADLEPALLTVEQGLSIDPALAPLVATLAGLLNGPLVQLLTLVEGLTTGLLPIVQTLLTALGLAPLLLSLQGTVDGLLTALGL